jgi:hypothetical protein
MYDPAMHIRLSLFQRLHNYSGTVFVVAITDPRLLFTKVAMRSQMPSTATPS